jgi:hypothetical protein
MKLIITQINKNPKSPINVDYAEHISRIGHTWCWDDSRYNTANAGKYFKYCFNYDTGFLDRLPSWSQKPKRPRVVVNSLVKVARNGWTQKDTGHMQNRIVQ